MRQHPRWPNALHPRLSPCRGASDRHPCSRAHAETVASWRAWRQAAQDDAERARYGDANTPGTEDVPALPTFRDYLRMTARPA